METLSSMQLCAATGASYRQVDYWCRGKVLTPVNGEACPGSGNRRAFDSLIVPAVRLLVRVSNNFHSLIQLETLKVIFENYEKGSADFDGLTLIWIE